MKFLPNWLRSSFLQKPVTSGRSLLIAKSAQELLLPHQNLLQQIRSQVSVPESHWMNLYQSFIKSFAELVQQLPASESHHHAFAGGLLQHSLEVGLHALQLRSGKMLPLGASPEVISEKQELWSYAVLTAAMMHDIGKPLVDQFDYHPLIQFLL
ncbi:MAG: TraI domain-containing protein [Thiotrichaceae bacterium]